MAKSCLVILPTRNEERTIARVAETVDTALQDVDLTIVQSDASSSDATVDAFRLANVRANTKTLRVTDAGKGRQVLAALKMYYRSTDVILILDTDNRAPLASIYKRLFFEIAHGADFSIVNYRRHWFEGNLTNHIARPLIFANLGIDVPQPISGELAISRRHAEFVLQTKERLPDSILPAVNGYGIDAFLLLTSGLFDGRITTVETQATKLHAPSFPHLAQIFREAVPVLCLPLFRRPSPILKKWIGQFELSEPTHSPDIASMIAALEGLGAVAGRPVQLPEALASVWFRCDGAAAALAAVDELWTDYLSSVRLYLQIGLSAGPVKAHEFLISASKRFFRKLDCLKDTR
jgi:hypothetical protein